MTTDERLCNCRRGPYGCEHDPVVASGVFSTDEQDDIREARSGALRPEYLKRYATHPSAKVRAEYARNPAARSGDLKPLLKDPDVEVRRSLAMSGVLTRKQLESLLTDRDDLVRELARNRLGLPRETMQERAAFQ